MGEAELKLGLKKQNGFDRLGRQSQEPMSVSRGGRIRALAGAVAVGRKGQRTES